MKMNKDLRGTTPDYAKLVNDRFEYYGHPPRLLYRPVLNSLIQDLSRNIKRMEDYLLRDKEFLWFNPAHGLCSNFLTAEDSDIRRFSIKLFAYWEYYSGADIYPVPLDSTPRQANDLRAQDAFYHNASGVRNMYDPTTPYGVMRLRLMKFLIEHLKEVVVELKCRLEDLEHVPTL